MRRRGNDAGQRGMAVLGALIVVVIVVALATTVGVRSAHSIAATTRGFEARAATSLFERLEAEAARVLQADERRERYDALDDAWAKAPLAVEAVAARGHGRLRDLQGLINLRDISFAADVLAQAGGGAQPEIVPPPAGANQDATSEDAALGGGAGGGLAGGAGRGLTPGVGGAEGAGGETAGMMALASVPGVVGAGLVGSAADAGEGVNLSAQQVALARVALLLHNLEIDPAVLPAILDWLDPDGDERFPNGAEDDYYSRRVPPYRAANRAFVDVSELRLVKGVDAATYEKLRRFVTVLPDSTPINVNTAPVEVLMSLAPSIDRPTAEMIVQTRKVRPFRSLEEFRGLPFLIGRPLVSLGLGVASDYFALDMQALSGQSELGARAVLARRGGDQLAVLSRDKGWFDE